LRFEFSGTDAFSFGNSNAIPYVLRQTGQVPADARLPTYMFKGDPFQLKINDAVLQPLEPGGYHSSRFEETSFSFDVSQFAGQEAELSLTGLEGPGSFPPSGGAGFLDSIAFVVPEPATLRLAAPGLLLFLLTHRYRIRRCCGRSPAPPAIGMSGN